MAGNIKNVILVGAGGAVGQAILPALLNSPHQYSVSVLSRDGSNFTPPDGVPNVKTDYTKESLVKALKGQDAVVCAIAGAAVLEQIKIIDAAIEAGVKRFIPSEYGSNTENTYSHAQVPLYALKYQVLGHLKANQDKIEWTALETGPFLDRALKFGFLGFDFNNKTVNTWDDRYRNVKFSVTRLTVVAQAVANLLSPSVAAKTANKPIYIREITTSLSSLLAAIEKSTNSTWTVKYIDYDALAEESLAKAKAGDFSGILHTIERNIIDSKSENDFDALGVVSNELLGIPDADVQSLADEIVAEIPTSK